MPVKLKHWHIYFERLFTNMKRRSIETKFFKDEYIQNLPADGRFLFLYLLTNEYVSITHIYQLPNTYISLDTGLSIKTIEKYQQKFQVDKKFLFKEGWIKIVNADKYEHYDGPLNVIAKKNQLDLIPCRILDYFDTPIDTPMYTPPIGDNNQYPIINNQYKEIESLREEEILDISTKYAVPVSFVKSKLDDLSNWHAMKPHKNCYANYYRALCNWVKRDSLKIKIDNGKSTRDLAI